MSNSGLQQIFEESVSQITATNSVNLGTERWEDGVKYSYVYNMSTSTATVKYGVVNSASSGYSVTISSVGGEGLAGVVVNTDIEPHNYGWVAVKGPVHITSTGATAIAQAYPVILGANGAFTAATGGTGYTGVVVGTATGSTATAGTFAAFINVG